MKAGKDDNNLIDNIGNRKTLLGIVVGMLYLIFTIIGAVFIKDTFLEYMYYTSQIVTGLFVTTGVIIALIQYISNNHEIEREHERTSIIEAANIADVYCDTIIVLSNILSKLYMNNDGLKEILTSIEKSDLKLFNKDELQSIFNKDIIPDWVSFLTAQFVKDNNIVCGNTKDVEKAKSSIMGTVMMLSNKLESLCIKLNTGIADKDTVYQSLHRDFFDSIQMIYPFLVFNNTNEFDRYYSNVSKLYIEWKEKHTEAQKREAKLNNIYQMNIQNEIIKNREIKK